MPGSRPVLLVMDFRHGIVESIADPSVLDAAGRAVKAARASGIPVMFVRVAFRPGYPEAAASNAAFGAMAERGDAMTQDHPATQVHAALEPRPDEPVVVKRRVSAFSGSDLDVLLRAADAGTLVLAGIATSGVVLSTLRRPRPRGAPRPAGEGLPQAGAGHRDRRMDPDTVTTAMIAAGTASAQPQ